MKSEPKLFPYSVLISFYASDNASDMKIAVDSMISQQLKPEQIVLVQDGPVCGDLNKLVDDYVSAFPDLFTIVVLSQNLGLGRALQRGINYCRNEVVARMDADDVALPTRMVKQLSFLAQNPDVVALGASILEFTKGSPQHGRNVRRLPTDSNKLIRFAKFRNPLNHQTVVFLKTAVIEVGGYQNVQSFEDYDLWIRLIKRGFRIANISEVLVLARTDGLLTRRSGREYARREIAFLKRLLNYGTLTRCELIVSAVVRIPIRLAPSPLINFIYSAIRRIPDSGCSPH